MKQKQRPLLHLGANTPAGGNLHEARGTRAECQKERGEAAPLTYSP
jgi:hypothetical protein